ncbi:hypothetical protein Hamer_G008605 [Homarus americanus]|uniref:Uncharacterized protein n=1 Tax=Homarus americanus TaxID=6706 RepID=A0A8J5N4G3_HOMAM|nr:hypothetical protein Hamer_G008605 [Homarus americanus]
MDGRGLGFDSRTDQDMLNSTMHRGSILKGEIMVLKDTCLHLQQIRQHGII